MSISSWFGFQIQTPSTELPELFPVSVSESDFVTNEIIAIYSKILTDTLERTQGLSDEQVALMWDNCVKSNSSDGLVTLLAKAMADKKELFVVYEKAAKIIRVATPDESTKIKADYEKTASSSLGIYISFKNYKRSDMVKFYIAIDYSSVGGLYKSMNLSKCIQFKISDYRGSVSLSDRAVAMAQALSVASGLNKGTAVAIDAKDLIETVKPDLTAIKESILFTLQKQCFYLGMPDSYLSGEQTEGIGSTGENDMRAVERGLKAYYFSIVKPVLEDLLGAKTSYKSQDFRQISSSMEVLKTFNLIDGVLVSEENKRKIINGMLGLPEDAEGDPPPKVEPLAVQTDGNPPKPGQKPPPATAE